MPRISIPIALGIVIVFGLLTTVPVAATIEVQSWMTGTTTTANLTISAPAGVVEGDFLLAQITVNNGKDVAITDPGWTLLNRLDSTDDIGQAIYYKTAGMSEPGSYSWTFGGSTRAAGGIIRLTGIDTTSPIVNLSGNNNTGGDYTRDDLVALGITAEADSLLVVFFSYDEEVYGLRAPSGMNELYDIVNTDGSGLRISSAVEVWGGGSTGTRTSSNDFDDDYWVAHLVALRHQKPLGSISGYVLNNSTSLGMPDWHVNLTDSTGFTTIVTTDSTGYYEFANLAWDTYNVSEEIVEGYLPVSPVSQVISINETNLNVGNVNFVNEVDSSYFITAILTGYKFDTWGNGLAGWNITATKGSAVLWNITDDSGFYYIDTGSGGWTLAEVQDKPDYIVVSPPGGSHGTVNTGSYDFINRGIGSISGFKNDTAGNRLNGWNITLRNITTLSPVYYNITHNEPGFGNGYYNISGIPFGTYWLNETLSDWPGATNVSLANRMVEINATTFSLTNQNFTNQLPETYCIDGYKYNDTTTTGLPDWNITVRNTTTGQIVGWNVTNDSGYWEVCGLPNGTYQVCEVNQPGWWNLTPICRVVTIDGADQTVEAFNNTYVGPCGDGAYEFFTDEGTLNEFAPNVPAGMSYWLFLHNARIGDWALGGKTEYAINTPTGQWSPGQSSSPLAVPSGQYAWQNNTYVTFNATYTPGLTYPASLEVGGTTIYQTSPFATRPNAVPIEDIIIRLHSEQNVNYFVEINNTTLHQGTIQYPLVNSHLIFNYDPVPNPPLQDIYLVIRANDILTDLGGSPLATGGYSVTGQLRFIWPVGEKPEPQENSIKMDIYAGRFSCEPKYCIEGYKIDNCTKLGLEGWNITLRNQTTGTFMGNVTTDDTGLYRICGLLPGNYTVCEEVENGWLNVTELCRYANITNANVTDVNFTNTRLLCINGTKYKDQEYGEVLEGFTIRVKNETDYEFGNDTTDEFGTYRICDLPPGDYKVCEDSKLGYVNVSPSCVDVTLGCENATGVNFVNRLEEQTYCINGTKIDHCTEDPIPDWAIAVYNLSGMVDSTSTDADGNYTICGLYPGDYWICEGNKTGYTNITPVCQNFTIDTSNVTRDFENARLLCINGTKYNDLTGEPIPDWGINITNSTGGVIQTQTGLDGNYSVCGLMPGEEYQVCEEERPGWTNVTDRCQNVTLECANETVVFRNRPVGYCIDGYKYEGPEGTVPLEGWNITVKNTTSQQIVGWNVTNDSGYWEICGLPNGTYQVCEVLEDYPEYVNLTPLCYEVIINGADNRSWEFRNVVKELSISGYKIYDYNGNGKWDPDESGLPLWNITLVNTSDLSVVDWNLTDITGYYTFMNVSFGTYYLNETLQYGWQSTNGTSKTIEVNSTSHEFTDLNFTNKLVLGNITGIKFEDKECDGDYDPPINELDTDADTLLPGWNITLYNATTGAFIANTTTDENGQFNFTGVDATATGGYKVTEELKPGWKNCTPTSVIVTFDSIVCPGIFHIFSDALLTARLPDTSIAFVPESRSGCTTTYELDIHSFNPGFTVVAQSGQNEFEWENGGIYDFNVTYTGRSGTDTVTYTITNGTFTKTLTWADTYDRPISDFMVRTRSATANSQMDVWNLTFTPAGGFTLVIPDSGTPGDTNTSWANFSAGRPLDILWIRAGALTGIPDLAENGFTLTGTQRMNWTGAKPTQSNLGYTIKFGKPFCPLDGSRYVVFGNQQQTYCIDGYKYEGPEGTVPLEGWNITVTNTSSQQIVGWNVTNDSGYWEVCGLPNGTYQVCEVLEDYPEYVNLTPLCYDVIIDGADNRSWEFRNEFRTYCIDGYKRTSSGVVLSGWNITLTNGSYTTSMTTGLDGKYEFCGLLPGTYTLTEQLKANWQQISAPGPVTLTDANATNQNFTNDPAPNVCCYCTPYPKFTYSKLPKDDLGYPVQFTDTSTGPIAVRWKWQFDDGTISNEQNPLHHFTRGTHRVKMSIQWLDCDGKLSTYWKSTTKDIRVG